jgi:biopolymer transport protein ExbB
MAGENIQLAQNTAAEGTPPADPMAPAAAPADAMPTDAMPPMEFEAAPMDTSGAEAAADEALTQENPYGLAQLWAQGDFVARGTLMILLAMSVYSWVIMLTKLWDQQKMLGHARQASKEFWTGKTLQESIGKLTGKGNPFRAIAESGVQASQHHEGRLTDKVPLTEWIAGNIQRSRDRMNNDMQRGLSFLASVGSTAPFVGLFGTVWGIYHALIAIGVAGQASIDKVAGPVGEALIMTAIGLAVAVPAVLGYNWLLRRNKAILDQVRYFTDDLYATLISGGDRK